MNTPDHAARRTELRAGYRALAEVLPAHMKGFAELHRAAVADGELPRSIKELMALAIGICVPCSGCVTLHVHDALRAGASPEQVHETIGLAVLMGGGPAATTAVTALEALEQFSPGASAAPNN